MPTLQVRDLPDSIYYKLKQQARTSDRSLAQQTIITLAKGLDISLDAPVRRKKALARIAVLVEKLNESNLPDPSSLIREDRER